MSLLRRFACIQSISKNKFSWSPEFIIDKRKGEREIVLSDWKMKKSGRSVRVEKADIKDLETIASQICEGFVNTNSLFIKLGATVEEIIPMFRERTRSILNQKLSLIAFDEKNRLVGMLGCRMDGIEEIEKFFGPRGEPVLEFQDDYAQEIQSGPWGSLNANRYHVVCQAAMKQTNKFLPKGIQKLGVPRALFVHPEFRGEGIGILLFAETKKLLKNLNCDGWTTFAVVDGSRNVTLHPANDMKVLFTFPYNKFKENGIPIFDELVDGTREHSIMYADL